MEPDSKSEDVATDRSSAANQRESWLAGLVLVAFALSFAQLGGRLLAFHQPVDYAPDWRSAKWIAGDEEAATRYFRFRFSLPELPDAAFLVVAGTDEIAAWINGSSLGGDAHLGARVTQLFDLRGLLRPGDNVLSVSVAARLQTADPNLIAKLVMDSATGERQVLTTPDGWQVSSREAYDPSSDSEWTSVEYDDRTWAPAVVMSPVDTPVRPMHFPEEIFSARVSTYRIWGSMTAPIATVAADISIDDAVVHGAFLEVGGANRVIVSINDVVLAPGIDTGGKSHVVSVADLLRPGVNQVRLTAESNRGQRFVFSRLWLHTDRGMRWMVPSDGRWYLIQPVAGGRPAFGFVQMFGQQSDISEDQRTRAVLASHIDIGRDWRSSALTFLRDAGAVTVGLILLYVPFRFLLQRWMNERRSLEVFAQPLLLALIAMGSVSLLQLDPELQKVLQPGAALLLALAALVIVLLGAILAEVRKLSRRISRG